MGKHPQEAPAQTAEFVSPTQTATFTETAVFQPGKRTAAGRAPRKDGKPAFRRDSENRPPCKPKGSVRGAQPSGSQEFAANPPYRPWENTRKKSPRKPRNS